ncbi:BRO family protein [Agrobacterium vitis]|uniref:BRO family protein n=1 Tax=Agrobacterium vitis TaxID=373 RepID=UPI0012E78C5E|nr:BRO family protein [Agrobacterium vitis]MUZ63498.1 phage antirepressor [Agrobacterium vitis]
MNMLLTFDFENQPVRAFERDGQEWFVAADVCRCLGLENSCQATSRLPDDEKCQVDLRAVTTDDGIRPGNPNATAINDPGVYRLIFESRKPEAERLKRFVFHEVLPALRRTGRFAPEPVIDWEIAREQIAMVREARLAHGKAAAAALWRDLGLPMPKDDAPEKERRQAEGLMKYVYDFIDECMVFDQVAEVTATEVYARYRQWSATNNAPYIMNMSFGKFLVRAGITRRKSNTTKYVGVRLKPPIRLPGQSS